jgi:hypothetical protein
VVICPLRDEPGARWCGCRPRGCSSTKSGWCRWPGACGSARSRRISGGGAGGQGPRRPGRRPVPAVTCPAGETAGRAGLGVDGQLRHSSPTFTLCDCLVTTWPIAGSSSAGSGVHAARGILHHGANSSVTNRRSTNTCPLPSRPEAPAGSSCGPRCKRTPNPQAMRRARTTAARSLSPGGQSDWSTRPGRGGPSKNAV